MVQGRIVWVSGDLFKGRIKTEFNSQTPRRNAQGETMMEYGFGLAVPKSVFQQCAPGQPGEIWNVMNAEAFKLFPNGQIPPSFAMKFKDGDGVDDQGAPFAQREGYAGCLVFAMTTSLPIRFFKWENGSNIQINEGIKCGDYVNVQVSVKAHPAMGAGKAGLYLNPMAVQFLGFGKEIINAPSGDNVFGAGMPSLPPGASAVPIAPAGQILPTAPPAGQYQGYVPAPAGPVAPPAYQPPTSAGQPAPHFGVVPPAFQPPPGGQPAAPQYQQPNGQYPPQNAPSPMQPAAIGMPPYPGAPR